MALPFDNDPNEGKPLADSGLPPGQLRLWRTAYTRSSDPWRVHCLLGATRPVVVRGYGGWGQVAREGRRAQAVFDGSETLAYSIALRLDNRRPSRTPVDEQMRSLERLCGLDSHDDTPPPVVNFLANVAHDQAQAAQNDWVCEDLEWGDSIATDRGTLLWQDATLVLGLHESTSVKGLRRSPGFARHTLSRGWDLRDFARRYLGDPKRWKDVAELNRDNPRCPSTPSFKVSRAVVLLTPPRE